MPPETTPLTANVVENATSSPNFIVPILIGLAIAVAIQLLLTHLAAAIGLSAVGDLTDRHTHDDNDEHGHHDESRHRRFFAGVQKLNHTLGVWGLVSATLALFVGTWLAVQTSLSIDPMSGVVIGLAIWAVFYCVAMYLESTLIGSLMRRAVSSMAGVAGGIGDIFSKSSKKVAAEQAGAVAAAVRDEVMEDRRVKDLSHRLQKTLHQLETNTDPRQLRKELEVLVRRTEIDTQVHEDDFGDVERVTSSIKSRPGPSSHTLGAAGHTASSATSVVQEEYSSDRRPADSVVRAAMRLAGVDDAAADGYMEKFENYLRTADEEVLDPDGLKDELEMLFGDPKAGWAALQARFQHADRSTLEGLLIARGFSEDRAHRVVDRAIKLSRRFAPSHEDRAELDEGWSNGHDLSHREKAKNRIRQYLDNVDDPRLDADEIERECELLFDDPKAGTEALIRRMKSMDRETLKAIIASRPGRSEEDAEHLLQRIESARDRVIARAETMKARIKERTEQAEIAARKTAEGSRRVASTAAWWAFGSAVTSGCAAALAGYLAISL